MAKKKQPEDETTEEETTEEETTEYTGVQPHPPGQEPAAVEEEAEPAVEEQE